MTLSEAAALAEEIHADARALHSKMIRLFDGSADAERIADKRCPNISAIPLVDDTATMRAGLKVALMYAEGAEP